MFRSFSPHEIKQQMSEKNWMDSYLLKDIKKIILRAIVSLLLEVHFM